jgi:hypothetical protein
MAIEDIRCRVRLSVRFATAGEARRAAAALEPDNEGFIRTTLKGRVLEAEAAASSIPALLHTMDDYLACLSVAARLGPAGKAQEG